MASPSEKSRAEDDRERARPEGLGGIVRRVFTHAPEPGGTPRAAARRAATRARRAGRDRRADPRRPRASVRSGCATRERRSSVSSASGSATSTSGSPTSCGSAASSTERESRIDDEEAEIARRRAELGAVELKRAALEQRDRTLAAREAEIEARETKPHGLERVKLAPETGRRRSRVRIPPLRPGSRVPARRERPTRARSRRGARAGRLEYVVARIGPSPLPGDGRRCAYLVRGGPGRRSVRRKLVDARPAARRLGRREQPRGGARPGSARTPPRRRRPRRTDEVASRTARSSPTDARRRAAAA